MINSKENIKKETMVSDAPKKPIANVEKSKPVLKKKTGIGAWWREIFFSVVNISLIILTVVYWVKIPEKAKFAKEQRAQSGVTREKLNLDLARFEVDASREKYEKLKILFPDQKQLLDFIGQIDKLKTDSVVTYFSFASETIVKEKSGYLGYPFVLEFNGTLTQISDGLELLNKLPYIFKPVNISIEKSEKPGLILLRYGGFLYVNETTQKN